MKQENKISKVTLDLFKAVFETAPDIAVNLLDKDYTVLWANKMMAIGCSRELDEMIGKPCYQAFRWRNKPCEVCVLQIVSGTKKPCVIERSLDLPNKERRYALVRAYPIFDTDGSVKHVFEIITMITKQKKEEERHRVYLESLEKTIKDLNANTPGAPDKNFAESVSLTQREREILRLIAQGFSNKEIANILKISLDTVKTHVKNIFLKFDVTDRTRAVVYAVSHNLM